MYAVIQISGNQYRVAEGDKLEVDKIPADPGTHLKLRALLVVNGDAVKVGSSLKSLVTAKILEHHKGKKIDIHKFHAKSRYRKHQGFRASLTTLLIEKIETEPPEKMKSKKITKTSKSSKKR